MEPKARAQFRRQAFLPPSRGERTACEFKPYVEEAVESACRCRKQQIRATLAARG